MQRLEMWEIRATNIEGDHNQDKTLIAKRNIFQRMFNFQANGTMK